MRRILYTSALVTRLLNVRGGHSTQLHLLRLSMLPGVTLRQRPNPLLLC